jgi:hypothetical protein
MIKVQIECQPMIMVHRPMIKVREILDYRWFGYAVAQFGR